MVVVAEDLARIAADIELIYRSYEPRIASRFMMPCPRSTGASSRWTTPAPRT
jgi:hypothetical protein